MLNGRNAVSNYAKPAIDLLENSRRFRLLDE